MNCTAWWVAALVFGFLGCAEGNETIPVPPRTGTPAGPSGGVSGNPTVSPFATCGGDRQTCCNGTLCQNGLTCNGGTCQAREACGAASQTCCTGQACQTGLVCSSGRCEARGECGRRGQRCCDSGACASGLACSGGADAGASGVCEPTEMMSCGGANQQCCNGTACASGLACRRDMGATPICATAAACGGSGQTCCGTGACNTGLTCRAGSCQTAPAGSPGGGVGTGSPGTGSPGTGSPGTRPGPSGSPGTGSPSTGSPASGPSSGGFGPGGMTPRPTPTCGARGQSCCTTGNQCAGSDLSCCGTTCVDVRSDDRNCGMCNNRCNDGRCNASRCTTAETTAPRPGTTRPSSCGAENQACCTSGPECANADLVCSTMGSGMTRSCIRRGSATRPMPTMPAMPMCLPVRSACTSGGSRCCDNLSCSPATGGATQCCIAAGRDCSNSNDCCGGMTCDRSSNKCVAVPGSGTCQNDADCANGLVCLPATTGMGKTCQSPRGSNPSSPADTCGRYSLAVPLSREGARSQCLAAECGWCATNDTCARGSASGPTTGSCSSWEYGRSTSTSTGLTEARCAGVTDCQACQALSSGVGGTTGCSWRPDAAGTYRCLPESADTWYGAPDDSCSQPASMMMTAATDNCGDVPARGRCVGYEGSKSVEWCEEREGRRTLMTRQCSGALVCSSQTSTVDCYSESFLQDILASRNGCTSSQSLCSDYRTCMTPCDGNRECPDGGDEANCGGSKPCGDLYDVGDRQCYGARYLRECAATGWVRVRDCGNENTCVGSECLGGTEPTGTPCGEGYAVGDRQCYQARTLRVCTERGFTDVRDCGGENSCVGSECIGGGTDTTTSSTPDCGIGIGVGDYVCREARYLKECTASGLQHVRDCGGENSCVGSECISSSAQPCGELYSVGDQMCYQARYLRQCTSSGWTEVRDCGSEYSCTGSSCNSSTEAMATRPCGEFANVGDKMCYGARHLRECTASGWRDVRDCGAEYSCVGSECTSDAPATASPCGDLYTTGDIICYGARYRRQCTATGWQELDDCGSENSCVGSECLGSPESPCGSLYVEGDRICKNARYVTQCYSYGWEEVQDCGGANSCVGSECIGGTPEPRDQELYCEFECGSTALTGIGADQCLTASARCNGIYDCGDYSDEDGCPGDDWSVNQDGDACMEYTCDNGGCYPYSGYCDGYPDCSDGSDESARYGCTLGGDDDDDSGTAGCSSGEYQCDDGGCYPTSSWCDGYSDCGDGSDEYPYYGCTLGDDDDDDSYYGDDDDDDSYYGDDDDDDDSSGGDTSDSCYYAYDGTCDYDTGACDYYTDTYDCGY